MPRGVITGGDGNTQGSANGGRIAVYDFNSIPATGPNDSVIINPIEGRVEESDVPFVGRRHGDRDERCPARRAHAARARHRASTSRTT